MAQPTLQTDLNFVQRAPLEVTTLNGDLNIIAKLDDEPNDVGGLTSAELKAEFDKAGNVIKTYLNETLIPELLASDAVEQGRETAESARAAAEKRRETAEEQRAAAEDARAVWEDYRPDRSYVPGNKVSYMGSSYVCTAPVTGEAPPAASWRLIAQKGDVGPVGPQGKGLVVLGYYDTLEALTAAQPSPAPGDAYGVGTDYPHNEYIWSGTDHRWVANGTLQGPAGPTGPVGPVGPQGEIGPVGPASQVFEVVLPAAGWSRARDTGVSTIAVAAAGIHADSILHVDHRFAGGSAPADYARYVTEENQFLDRITNGYALPYEGGIRFYVFGEPNNVDIPLAAEVRG